MKKKVALLGEYTPTFQPHISTGKAIEHSCSLLSVDLEGVWVSTENISDSLFDVYSGIWVAPGSPYKNMDKTLWAIRYARENGIPCIGTCGGFQHIIIEYTRNVLGFKDAQHAEYDPYASALFISKLDCSLVGREMTLNFVAESHVATIYGALTAIEQYYCNFGVNPEYIPLLKNSSLKITGSDREGEVRVIELSAHPFFIGTLFVPQARSTAEIPHPLVTAFLKVIVENSSPT
ncbi:CTP synthase [Pleurocapsales cyanobacterium LEGE 06147]|nr:CTP synthase [Pleurocapsales cyanobacterium LEGE 06147]